MKNENVILVEKIVESYKKKFGPIQDCCLLYLKYCRCSKEKENKK